jgi:hypothetical protein
MADCVNSSRPEVAPVTALLIVVDVPATGTVLPKLLLPAEPPT